MEFQLNLEKLKIEKGQTPSKVTDSNAKYKGPKVLKFKEGQDIDSYLHTFEKFAEVYEWPKETWAMRLAALLAGKAYARMDRDESKEYIKVKKAILKRYELTSEAYRRKFRSSRRAADETFAEWSVRLTRYVDQWMEAEDIGPFTQKGDEANKIKDLFIREQLLENSLSDIRTWLKERKPKSVKEMIELGDQYLASHWYHSGEGKIMKFGSNHVQDQSHGKPHFKEESNKNRYKCNRKEHIAADCKFQFAKSKTGLY